MKHFTVSELKLSNYKSISGPTPAEVVGGSRPRLALVHKNSNQKFFFKTYTHNPREVWAECLASHIAELMELKAQQVTIKTAPRGLEQTLRKRYPKQIPSNWKPIGTLARNIFPKNIEITYGAIIVGTPTDALKLSDIEQKIRQRYYAPDDLLQTFADMVVFDALTGNMDRHHENWGVCEDKKYKQQLLFDKKQMKGLRYFTPLFDHGSSLMFELNDQDVQTMLQDETRLKAYIAQSKFGFILDEDGSKVNMFDMLERHIHDKTAWQKRFMKSLEKVKNIDLLALAGLVIQMPSLEMLEYGIDRRTLLYSSLLMRYNKLNDIYEKG